MRVRVAFVVCVCEGERDLYYSLAGIHHRKIHTHGHTHTKIITAGIRHFSNTSFIIYFLSLYPSIIILYFTLVLRESVADYWIGLTNQDGGEYRWCDDTLLNNKKIEGKIKVVAGGRGCVSAESGDPNWNSGRVLYLRNCSLSYAYVCEVNSSKFTERMRVRDVKGHHKRVCV